MVTTEGKDIKNCAKGKLIERRNEFKAVISYQYLRRYPSNQTFLSSWISKNKKKKFRKDEKRLQRLHTDIIEATFFF